MILLSFMRENKFLECLEIIRNIMMDGCLVLIRKWCIGILGIVVCLGLVFFFGRFRVMILGFFLNGFILIID